MNSRCPECGEEVAAQLGIAPLEETSEQTAGQEERAEREQHHEGAEDRIAADGRETRVSAEVLAITNRSGAFASDAVKSSVKPLAK